MRRFALAAMVVVMAQGASAADLPILRGAYVEPTFRSYTKWEGFYVGGHAGYSSHDFDFSKTIQGLQKELVRQSVLEASISQWELLGSSNQRSTAFGGFVGYNLQWEDAVIGVEANYTHFGGKAGTSSGSMARTISNPDGSNPPPGHFYEYDASLSGAASARVNDLVTLRVRGGWSVGSFMPYAFAGLAAGFVDISRSATLSITTRDQYTENVVVGFTAGGAPITVPVARNDVIARSTESRAESQKNLLTFGFTAGVGFEYLVTPNIFLRAEYEYTQLPLAKDTIIQLNTGRVGVGAKF